MLLRAVPVALALLLVCVDGAAAQPVSFPAPARPVRPGADRTYADLVAIVVPGVVVNGEKYSGGDVIAVRNIAGGDLEDIEPESMEALRVAAVPVRSGGQDRMALLLDFGRGKYDAGFAILALFDVADKPRLLDAANVATSRHTSFFNPVRLSVGAGDDLLMTRSAHFNSSQGYTTVALITCAMTGSNPSIRFSPSTKRPALLNARSSSMSGKREESLLPASRQS